MSRTPRPSDSLAEAAPLAALIALRALAQVYELLWHGGMSLAADSADRVFIALKWATHPSFFVRPSAWLPVFFWAYGTALGVWTDPIPCSVALTAAIGLGSLIPLYGVCRRIGAGREASLLAVAAAGFMPLTRMVDSQPFFDPLFRALVLSAIYAWLRSEDGALRRWHLASIGLWGAAALTRFEAWIFIAVWLVLTAKRAGFRLRLLALSPVALCLGREFFDFGRFEALSVVRERGLIVEAEQDWRAVWGLWTRVFLAGKLAPFSIAAFATLDYRRQAARDALALVWLPFLTFAILTTFFGFPAPYEHLSLFLILQFIPMAPGIERALDAWSAAVREWRVTWERPVRLALAMTLSAGASLGAMMTDAPGPGRPVGDWLVANVRRGLAPGEQLLLELPLKGSEDSAGDAFGDPETLRLLAFPRELVFDRPFKYRHDPDRTYSLIDSAPSTLSLPKEELRRRLEPVRAVLARSDSKPLEALGWKRAGKLGAWVWYARPGDFLYEKIRRAISVGNGGLLVRGGQ